MVEADPASARPKPSRMDFLPSSMTSGGMSEYFVPTMNSATDFVSPGAFGNSAAGAGSAETVPAPAAKAENDSEVLNSSRRFMLSMKYRRKRGQTCHSPFPRPYPRASAPVRPDETGCAPS